MDRNPHADQALSNVIPTIYQLRYTKSAYLGSGRICLFIC